METSACKAQDKPPNMHGAVKNKYTRMHTSAFKAQYTPPTFTAQCIIYILGCKHQLA
jgi:hypothetical protein